MDKPPISELEARLGVRFKDQMLIQRALTHRSAAAEGESNERLEFFGDSVVGLVVSELLFRLFPDRSEGDLAKSKAYAVSAPALAEAAEALGLYDFIVVSNSEEAAGGRRRNSIMADAFEAVIAAVYLDSGIRSAKRIVRRSLMPAVNEIMSNQHLRDFKSLLQEQTQARTRRAPKYSILSETGKAHEKVFTAQVKVDGNIVGEGAGGNKKEAEQAAAHDALVKLEYLPIHAGLRTDPNLDSTHDAPRSTLDSG